MPRLRAETLARASLTESDILSMYALYSTYFEATSEPLFRADLAEKQFVVVLRDAQALLRGFSTGALLKGAGVNAFFSGDTIVHHDYWGEQTLPLAFAALAARLKSQQPEAPLYWLLISKGYRTYRYLPLFFYEYYPRFGTDAPPAMQRLMDQFAIDKFGDAYLPREGIVRFSQSRGHLREAWAGVRDAVRQKQDVAFFLRHNPGFQLGDELVCIAELASANIRPFARRIFDETLAGDVTLV